MSAFTRVCDALWQRVSKDGHTPRSLPPSFETPAFGRLLRMRRSYAARLSAPPSRSSAASSVASCLAKQKRTTERIGSLA